MALTVPETAYELNCHPNTVWNLIKAGELKSFTLGRKPLVARVAIAELMVHREGPLSPPFLRVVLEPRLDSRELSSRRQVLQARDAGGVHQEAAQGARSGAELWLNLTDGEMMSVE